MSELKALIEVKQQELEDLQKALKEINTEGQKLFMEMQANQNKVTETKKLIEYISKDIETFSKALGKSKEKPAEIGQKPAEPIKA